MTKVSKVPLDVLKEREHPIVPGDAKEADFTFVQDGGDTYIIFETIGGTAVFDNNCSLTQFRQEGGTFGAIELTDEQPIGSSVWKSAEEICRNYTKTSDK
jgi:hypothetical protein